MQLRDPVMYRIRRGHHHRTHDAWVIYPTYDWAHGQSDAIEGVTHSLCTLEFDSHRALYDWFLEQLPLPYDQPRQTEFARLELTHTVTSKRKLATLVADGIVDGWDDPRMPTLRGLRRRGYPAAAIREFCRVHRRRPHQQPAPDRAARVVRAQRAQPHRAAADGGAATVADGRHGLADRCRRQPGRRARSTMLNNPENEADGVRSVAFSGELFIERDDFMLDPPPKFFRLSPGPRGAPAWRVSRHVHARRRRRRRQRHDGVRDARPGVTRRQRARRPQGEVDDALGVGRARRAGHGRAVRAAVHAPRCRAPATDDPLDDLNRDSRELITDCNRRAGARRHGARRGRAVRAARLLRPRSARADAVPSNGRPQGRVGEHPEARLTRSPFCPRDSIDKVDRSAEGSHEGCHGRIRGDRDRRGVLLLGLLRDEDRDPHLGILRRLHARRRGDVVLRRQRVPQHRARLDPRILHRAPVRADRLPVLRDRGRARLRGDRLHVRRGSDDRPEHRLGVVRDPHRRGGRHPVRHLRRRRRNCRWWCWSCSARSPVRWR